MNSIKKTIIIKTILYGLIFVLSSASSSDSLGDIKTDWYENGNKKFVKKYYKKN